MLEEKKSGRICEILPEPSPLQGRLLQAAGVTLPKTKKLPPVLENIFVDTRVKLQDERKSA